MAFASGPLQFFPQLEESVFIGIEERHVLADDLTALVAVNAFRSRIPGDYLSVYIQQEQRIVLHPSRNTALGGLYVHLHRPAAWRVGGLVPQHQKMSYRQHVPFG